MNKQYVIIQFSNTEPAIELFESYNPITLESVLNYYATNDGFDPEVDSITLVDAPSPIKI